MFWRKKKQKPFTVEVCWANGETEFFSGTIGWRFLSNSILLLEFKEKEDIYLCIPQMMWFLSVDWY